MQKVDLTDLAKPVFHVRVISADGQVKSNNALSRNKNDRNDAIAIVEADSRPKMRDVHEKTLEQQDIQCLHLIRQLLMKNRTALINQIRGLGIEYGIAILTGADQIEKCLPEHLVHAESDLTALNREFLNELRLELKELNRECQAIEHQLSELGKQDPATTTWH